MNVRSNTVTAIGSLVGALMIGVVCWVYLKHQEFGLGGSVLTLLGVVLLGFSISIWKSVKLSLGSKGGISAKFDQGYSQYARKETEPLERDVKDVRKEVKELETIVISEGSALSTVPKDRLLEIRKQDKVYRLVAQDKYEEALAIDPKAIIALTGLIQKKVADSEYREAASYTAALKAANGSGVEFSAYPDVILAYDKIQEPAEAAQLIGELDAAVTDDVSEGCGYYSGSEQLMWLNDSLKKVEPQISDSQLAKAVAALVRKIENTIRDLAT